MARAASRDKAVTIGDTAFDRVDHDREADVLYLSVGDSQPSAQTYGAPEGHAVRQDHDGHTIGITLVDAKLLLDRGDMHVTIPQGVDVQPDRLEPALT